MTNHRSLQSNIGKFYAIQALGIRFIAPIRIIYLLYFGLNFAQIGTMEMAAAVTALLLEIPSGILADLIGRKASRLIAYGLSIIAFTLMSLGSTLTIFVIGWMMSGAADAFQSGAQDALVFDTLKELNREKEYIKIKSQFLLINTVAVITGAILGSGLYQIDHRLPWYLLTGTIILSAMIFATVTEPPGLTKIKNFREQLSVFKKSLRTSIENAEVQRIIGITMILAVPMFVFTTMFNQPYLLDRGYSVTSLGVIFAVITGLGGIIAALTYKIEPLLKRRTAFLGIILAFTGLLTAMGMIHDPGVLGLIIIFYIVDNFKNVVLDNYLNQTIGSESRATVISIQSFVNNAALSLLLVLIGSIADKFSIDAVLILMGLLIGIFCLPAALIYNRARAGSRIREI